MQHPHTLSPLRLGAVNIHPSLLPKVSPPALPHRFGACVQLSALAMALCRGCRLPARALGCRWSLLARPPPLPRALPRSPGFVLPSQYRGPCPLEHTLLNGDKKTGVALIRIDPHHIDVGNVVSLTDAVVEDSDTLATYVVGATARLGRGPVFAWWGKGDELARAPPWLSALRPCVLQVVGRWGRVPVPVQPH